MIEFTQERINSFLHALNEDGIENHAIVIRQHGNIIYSHAQDPYDLNWLHPVYSVTKSFTSIAMGFLVQEHHLDLNTPWLAYFPEYKTKATDAFQKVTLRHLLTMTLGQDAEAWISAEDDWITQIVSKPIVYEPGTKFMYNSHCSYLIGRLIEKLSGQTLKSYLKTRLFDPLAVHDYTWDTDKDGHCTGGFGLHLKIEDLSKFGQCILNDGKWNQQQIIPADWIHQATCRQVSNASEYPPQRSENRQGYGYYFWRSTHNAFRCSGLHGQICLIWPENDLVLAMNNCTSGSQAVLNAFFRSLDETYAGSPESLVELPKGRENSPYESMLNGSYTAEENPADIVSMDISQKENILFIHLMTKRNSYSFKASYETWLHQSNKWKDFTRIHWHDFVQEEHPYSGDFCAAYAWSTPDLLDIRMHSYDSAASYHITIQIDQEHIVMEYAVNGIYTMFPSFEASFTKH